MAKYRTAIIACGNIARVHARAWQNVPGQPASTSSAFELSIEVSPAKPDNLYCVTVHSGFYPSELYIYDFGLNAWHLVYGSADQHVGGGHAFGVSPFNSNQIFLAENTEGRRYDYGANPPIIDYNSTYPPPAAPTTPTSDAWYRTR